MRLAWFGAVGMGTDPQNARRAPKEQQRAREHRAGSTKPRRGQHKPDTAHKRACLLRFNRPPLLPLPPAIRANSRSDGSCCTSVSVTADVHLASCTANDEPGSKRPRRANNKQRATTNWQHNEQTERSRRGERRKFQGNEKRRDES